MIHARSDYTERIQDSANLIPHDEPVLLIRGQDVLAPLIAEMWAQLHEEAGGDPRVSEMVLIHAERIRDWQNDNGSKVADVPAEVIVEALGSE